MKKEINRKITTNVSDITVNPIGNSKDFQVLPPPSYDGIHEEGEAKIPTKFIHIKVYCARCGELLLHEKRTIIEGQTYMGFSVDPCPTCSSGMYTLGMQAGEGKPLREGIMR